MIRRLAITPGEPAGIGPDLCLALTGAGGPALADTELVLVADPDMLTERARRLGLTPPELPAFDADVPRPLAAHGPTVAAVPLAQPCRAGQPDTANARYVLDTLDRAIDLCRQGRVDAMVTGPVHKALINEAGVPFSGHTEYLAHACGVPRTVMMLATEGLRVALATTHLPLREVADRLSAALLAETLDILHGDLRARFNLAAPRIAVCGLNPHAGEGGHLGREEIDIIEPVLAERRNQGMDLRGPLPADTLFTEHILRDCDAVLAMYHDQGLPVLKYKGFGRAANITLGLPIIRTSVDHGTALDLAGTGRAEAGSLRYAIETAAAMAGAAAEAA